MMGELRQTSGSIKLWGQEITTLSTAERIARGVSRTYQVPRPFADLNVRENIRVGLMPDSLRAMIFGTADEAQETELALSVGFNRVQIRVLVLHPLGCCR